jgi:hypothetical protein
MQASRSSKRWHEPEKKRKRIEGRGLDSKIFIFKNSSLYSMVKDVGSQKADITIGQLVVMVPSARRKLKKGLSTLKVLKLPTPLNVITTKCQCDPIIDVQCNGSMLHGVLVDKRAKINVMTIPVMRYLGLKIDRPALIPLKLAIK